MLECHRCGEKFSHVWGKFAHISICEQAMTPQNVQSLDDLLKLSKAKSK